MSVGVSRYLEMSSEGGSPAVCQSEVRLSAEPYGRDPEDQT